MEQNVELNLHFLMEQDPAVAEAMAGELNRQQRNLELIASENLASPAVMAAMGSVLTNKYAEGYPGKRYYGGCEFVDVVENLAIERAKQLFGAEYVNVQPRRPRARHEPAKRRPSHARHAGQPVRQVL